jgi:cephalosporin hydroxylase
MKKKILTRSQFETLRNRAAAAMGRDKALVRDSRKLLVRADKHYWIHQPNWFGEPVLQLAQDIVALQEIVYATRPDYIVEVGTAWAGSLLFYSSLMEVLGGRKIIGVDIFIPPDLRRRIGRFKRLSRRIQFVEGSSIDPDIVAKVKKLVGRSKKVLVHLDSHHSHDHVLAELKAYAPLVGKGQYLICGDTIIEYMGDANRSRPWGPGDNPLTAQRAFMRGNKDFVIDRAVEDKLLFSCNPDGYLRRVRA